MNPYEPMSLPLPNIDWIAHVPLIGQAHDALGVYKGMLNGIPNPAIMLSPLTTQEAVLSSRIEGTQASIEEVLQYEADPKEEMTASKHADIREIINYRQAMKSAVEDLKERPSCLNLMKKLHFILLDSVRGQNKGRGEFRRSQNFIGPYGATIEQATYVPPVWDKVEGAMGNWEKYLHADEKDRLVQLAVAKAQFELIHPFLDGNGRLGRMLVPLYLFEKGVLSSPMFYISAYLETHRDAYYANLQAVSRTGDWNSWIGFFLSALIDQAKANEAKTRSILDLYERMKKEIPGTLRSQYVVQAIDALFERPVFSSSDFIASTKIPRESAFRILSLLKRHKLLTDLRPGKGRRATILMFPELLKITEGV